MCADVMLVSSYYSRAGRVVDAHSTIGLTVHLWLHVGDAMEVVQMRDTNSLALPPADPIDGGERVNIRWVLTICEVAVSLGAGLTSSAPVEVSYNGFMDKTLHFSLLCRIEPL